MTERQTLSQVNQGLMDALGLGDLAHKCRSVQVSLHNSSRPTARLDLVINKTTGETARRYVRLVPEDVETEQPITCGFDIDGACDRVRAVVAEAIEAKAEKVRFEVNCIFSTIRFPRFSTERIGYSRKLQVEPANAEALAAFRNVRSSMMHLDLLASSSPTGNAKTLVQAAPDRIWRPIAWLTKGILFNVFAGTLLLIPACLELSSLGRTEEVKNPIQLDVTGGLPVHVGVFALGNQPTADRLDSNVVVLSDVTRQSSAVPQKDTERKRDDRNRGALQKFFDEHPVASNLLLSMLTLLGGFVVGGGFSGGTR